PAAHRLSTGFYRLRLGPRHRHAAHAQWKQRYMTTKRKTKKRANSVLGLTLFDGQLRACHVTRAKGGPEVVNAGSARMTLGFLSPEVEQVGREIKNHLDEAGIRERRCVVGLPPRWVMSQHTKVPQLEPEDVASFLEIEAEKGFPVDL